MFAKHLLAVSLLSALAAASGSAVAAREDAIASLSASSFNVLEREASEGAPGADNERPGDRQRRKGRGKRAEAPVQDGVVPVLMAREASEGARGADNERPGDRQRRGGRGRG